MSFNWQMHVENKVHTHNRIRKSCKESESWHLQLNGCRVQILYWLRSLRPRKTITTFFLLCEHPGSKTPNVRQRPRVITEIRKVKNRLTAVYKQESSITVLWENPLSLWLKQMLRSTAKHWTEVWKSYRRVGRRIEVRERDRNSRRRPIESTNLDPWQLSET